MKYCRACKLAAKDTETVCRRCGGPVSVLGEKPAVQPTGEPNSGPALGLQGQIGDLKSLQKRNVQRIRLLIAACAVVLIGLVVIPYQVFAYRVLAYAELENVQIEQDPAAENLIRVSFNVRTPGKVAFDRRSGGNRTEKVDVFSEEGSEELSWAWPSEGEIDFRVVYRNGWSRTFRQREFDVTGKGGRVDVVFLIDKTASMVPFIKGLKQECDAFAQMVRREGYDIRLGLVGFGDVIADRPRGRKGEEPIVVHKPTDEIQRFQTWVGDLKVTGGGDLPESGVEALHAALDLQFRSGAAVCFVHITDAACHHTERLPKIAAALKQRGIVTYVVSTEEQANLYRQLCTGGGKFYAMGEAEFQDIVRLVAQELVNEIKYK